jgi:hypothetical protein
MTTIARHRTLLTRVDLLPVAVGLVALVTYVLHGVNGALSRDLGVYAYAGQQVADGVPPYVGILNRAGPLAHVIPALGVLGARLAGIDELLGMRLLFLALSVLCVCLAYLVGRDLFHSRLAGLVTAGAFLTFAGFIEYASNGPREKTPMVLFMLGAFWALAHRRWFTAGLLTALATLVLQIAFFVCLPALVVGALAAGGRLRAIVRIGVGGLTPLALSAAYFAAVGALGEFVDAFVLINARYTPSNEITADGLAKDWRNLSSAYDQSLWVLVVGLVALVAIALVSLLIEDRRRRSATAIVVALAAAAVTGVLWTAQDYDSWPDAFPLLPLAALGVGALAREVTLRVPRSAAVAGVVVWCIVTSTLAIHTSVTGRSHDLVAQRRSTSAVLGRLPQDASVLSIQAPQPLVLSGRRNPTRMQMFGNGLDRYVDDTWPGGLAGFVSEIKQAQPEVIAVGKSSLTSWAPRIEDDYVRFGRADGWAWYGHRSLGEDELSALAQAARKARPRG